MSKILNQSVRIEHFLIINKERDYKLITDGNDDEIINKSYNHAHGIMNKTKESTFISRFILSEGIFDESV